MMLELPRCVGCGQLVTIGRAGPVPGGMAVEAVAYGVVKRCGCGEKRMRVNFDPSKPAFEDA